MARTIIFLCLGLALLAGTPDRLAAQEPYTFVFLADSRSDSLERINETAFRQVMTSVAERQPSFVFFGGDLAWGFDSRLRVLDDFAAWRGVVDDHYDLDRVYPVFGGHERVGRPGTRDARLRSTLSAFRLAFDPVSRGAAPHDPDGPDEPVLSCQYYHSSFGPPRDRLDLTTSHTVYFCDFQEDRFFVLNNDCIPPSHSQTGDAPDGWGCVGHELGCGQFNWLRHHLVGNGKRHNFIFHHEPAFGTGAHDAKNEAEPPRDPSLMSVCGDRSRTMDNKQGPRNDYIRLLGYYNGSAIFSGHEHQYTRRFIDNAFLERTLNNPSGVRSNSLVVLMEADPGTGGRGPSTAYSYDGARTEGRRDRAPKLKLWWTSKGGKPDWTGRVADGRDDAEEVGGAGGAPRLDSGGLEFKRNLVALRWTNIPLLEEGQTIKKAKIEFTAKRGTKKGPRVRVWAEAGLYAFPFSQCAADLSRRPTRPDSRLWQIKPWLTKGRRYQTRNLADVIGPAVESALGPFPLSFDEVKAGSCGAPWNEYACPDYTGSEVHERMIDLDDGQPPPYHYVVVEVDGNALTITAYDHNGVALVQ